MVDPASRSSAAQAGAKGETHIEEPSRIQRTIARRSAEARATVPDFEMSAEVEMSACLALREARGCSHRATLVRACALALREVPHANGAYRDGHFELHSRVNVGIALELEEAYVVPTVLDADCKSLAELTEEIDRLASRTELSPPELSGATFTLSDLGPFGVATATPIVTTPQAAAVAAGAVREVPVVRGGAIVAGHAMTLTLACDHRILFGAEAARFLTAIGSRLEEAAL